jgi:small-conductance mechanosensitive channel
MPTTSLHDANPLTADELTKLWTQLHQPNALAELGLLIACLGGAWLIARLTRGRQSDPKSIWFGQHVVDGVLFPILALLLALGMRRLVVELGIPLAVFRVAIPVLVSLAVIRLTVKVLGVVFPTAPAVRVIERTVSWMAWVGSVLWIVGVMPLMLAELEGVSWKIGAGQVSLRNLVEGAFSAVLVLILSLSLSSAIESWLLKGATDNLSLRKIMANLSRALLLTVGLMMALSAVGIDLTALSVLGGAVGVGLGFGLQKLAANYVSGFVILAERSLRIGDMVKIDNFEGRITDINTRYTVLRSAAGRQAIIPNEMMITQRVENASQADSKLQLTTDIMVAHGTDLEVLRPALVDALIKVPRVMASPGPAVHLTAFAPDGLVLTVTFVIPDPENNQLVVRSGVNLAILATLNQLKVEIPIPQRVVHLRAPLEVSSAEHDITHDAT